jgi:acid phosphatase
MFLRGFLGPLASSLGNVVTVAPSSSPLSLGDSLSPSDLCPNFVDGNGGTYAPAWDAIYLPPVTARINAMISGNLTFTTSDVSIFPYLCGFESQITGNLSPWCGVFTDEELKQYEYRQDLRYFYGTGPGTKLPQTMMLPFLNRLVEILAEGPGITGKYANGSIYNLPNIIMAFANDGQLSETVAGSGVFDEQQMLPADRMPEDRTYMASHFDSMRGTIAFERLNCIVPISSNNSSSSSSTATSTKSSSSSSTYGYSNMTSSTSRLSSSAYSNSTATGSSTFSTSVRSATASSSAGTEKIVTITNHQITTICPPEPTQRANSYSRRAVNSTATTNQTYIRIRLNDAVYPVPSCQDGPGRSCLMSKYAAYIAAKYAASGSWHDNCNVTNPLSPTQVKGASFFTDLSSPWLANVSP